MKSFTETWQASEWGEEIADAITVTLPGETEPDYEIRTLKDLENIADAPIDLIAFVRGEVERALPTLAENELIDVNGKRFAFRWHQGSRQLRCECGTCESWADWESWASKHCVEWPEALAWFRANCPPDRFVTDEGEVIRFEMTEDGGAVARKADGNPVVSVGPGDGSAVWAFQGYGGVAELLYRFRDQEREKWRFEVMADGVVVSGPGHEASRGLAHRYPFSASVPWSGAALTMPTWVRNHAEALYREKNPEWRVVWGGFWVLLYENGNHRGCFDERGLTPGLEVPPHVLTQARALFREKYQLKRDEIWFQGMPVKMVFDLAGDCVRAQGTEVAWREENGLGMGLFDFLDRDENTEAITRMRRFYYEEHPGKAFDEHTGPISFVMIGDIGVGLQGEKEWGRSDMDPSKHSMRHHQNLEKLRAWTEGQRKKCLKTESQIIDLDVLDGLHGAHLGGRSRLCSVFENYRGKVKVTIEPVKEVE